MSFVCFLCPLSSWSFFNNFLVSYAFKIFDFNQKEGILKASHTKKKIITLIFSKPYFRLKSSCYLFTFKADSMLFVSFIEDFNGKEGILKASQTKEKITTIFFFRSKSSFYLFIFLSFLFFKKAV